MSEGEFREGGEKRVGLGERSLCSVDSRCEVLVKDGFGLRRLLRRRVWRRGGLVEVKLMFALIFV